MHVTLADLVLFAHIAFVIVGLMLAAVLHLGLAQFRRARTVEQLRWWTPVIHRVEPLLPVFALLLVASGAWLIHLSGGEFAWSDAWVIASIVALVVVEGLGGILAPRSKAMQLKVAEAPDGPVTPALRRAVVDPVFWYMAHFGTAEFFGIVFLMVAKPSAAWSVGVLVLAAIAGVATAVPFVGRSHRVEEAQAQAPEARAS